MLQVVRVCCSCDYAMRHLDEILIFLNFLRPQFLLDNENLFHSNQKIVNLAVWLEAFWWFLSLSIHASGLAGFAGEKQPTEPTLSHLNTGKQSVFQYLTVYMGTHVWSYVHTCVQYPVDYVISWILYRKTWKKKFFLGIFFSGCFDVFYVTLDFVVRHYCFFSFFSFLALISCFRVVAVYVGIFFIWL